MLGDQPLQPHQAGVAEQVRTDLALLERRQVDAVNAARQQPRQVGLAHRQRQPNSLAICASVISLAKRLNSFISCGDSLLRSADIGSCKLILRSALQWGNYSLFGMPASIVPKDIVLKVSFRPSLCLLGTKKPPPGRSGDGFLSLTHAIHRPRKDGTDDAWNGEWNVNRAALVRVMLSRR